MTRSLESRQLVIFFGLAYGIAWLFFLLLGLSRAGLGWIPLTLSLPVMSVLGTLALLHVGWRHCWATKLYATGGVRNL